MSNSNFNIDDLNDFDEETKKMLVGLQASKSFLNFDDFESRNNDENHPLNQIKIKDKFSEIVYDEETSLSPNNLWEKINHYSRPHHFFKLDWSIYYSLDFADTFLPHADGMLGKAIWMYDGAALFDNLHTTDSKQFRFDSSKAPINLISYSYPNTVAAANAKDLVQISENEICTFIEVQEDNNINIYFKFGTNFISACRKNFTKEKINFSALEGKAFKTDVETFKSFFNNELVHYTMMQFILSTIGIKDLTSLYKLESAFAQEQLKQIAKEMGKIAFSIFILTVFGKDINIDAIYKFYEDLLIDKLEKPSIVVVSNPLNGRKANYDLEKKQIIIWENFIDNALIEEEEKATLLIALIEEYGHHIDNLLRYIYGGGKNIKPDYFDEGANFAFIFLTKATLKLKDISFAKASIPYFDGELKTNFELVKKEANKIYTKGNFYDENPKEKIKGFGAGFNPGEHGGIELTALVKLFSNDEIYKIYYGNWLRDYSQLLLGSTIRLTEAAKKEVEQSADLYILNILKANSSKISHQGWVDLLEIFAAKEFVFELDNPNKFCHQYSDHVKTFRERYGTLTKDILGIYRPEEHIDNPKGLKDESKLPISYNYEGEKSNPRLLKLYAGETPESLDIDSKFLLKKYIYKQNLTQDRPTSDYFLQQQIKLAAQYGKSKEGFRHLGAALHVVEDFFSHSNFVEVALIKYGSVQTDEVLKKYKYVYPWVEGMQGKDYKTIPIVTGIFLTDDTIASVLPKLADKMFPIDFEDYEQRKEGDRTFSDALIITILTDFSLSDEKDKKFYGFSASEWLYAYNQYLSLVDFKCFLVENTFFIGEWIDRLLQTASEVFSSFNNLAYNLLLQSTDETIKETQTLQTYINYGTNPTHTQLAKDATNHPLNDLAAILSSVAVKDIAERIKIILDTGIDANGEQLAKYVVNKYTRHPKDTSWEMVEVKNWAIKYKNIATKLASPTIYDYSEKVVERVIDNDIFKKLINF